MAARRQRSSRGSALWLGAAFLLLLAVSLGMRYGGGLRQLWPDRAAPPAARSRATAQRMAEARTAMPPAAESGERILRLQVINATGVNRLALQTGDRLRAWDVDVLDRSNAPAWPFPETLLLVRELGSASHEAVSELAERLGGVPVILQRREDLVLDATLVLGHDWEDYDWPEP